MSSGGGAKGGGGGGGGSGNRVSIPSNVRKTIQNIKEITGSHSEEDIYAMLKECSMDPNETAQKLLLQDTFHEVKRKRDRKKENQSKDPTEPRWKPGMQGRGNRSGRGTHSSRNLSHDATLGGRNSAPAKENGPNQDSEKDGSISSLPTSLETKSKEANSIASLLAAKTNGPTALVTGNMSIMHDTHTSTHSGTGKLAEEWAPSEANKNPVTASGTWDQYVQQIPDSSSCSTSTTPGKSSGAYFSSSDPVLSSSQELKLSGVVGTAKSEVGIQQTVVEQISANSDKSKSTSVASEAGSSSIQGKIPSKSLDGGKDQHLDSSQTTSSLHTISPVSRPSSNYSNRSQVIGPQKVGPSKEWKPKSTIPTVTQGSGAATSSEASSISVEANVKMSPALNALGSKEANVELHKKLEELRISGGQHVIIPNHLHVPEVEKLGFCFGSFDASFGVSMGNNSSPENDQTAPLSETSDGNDEAPEEQFSSNQNAFGTVDEVDFPENNQSSSYEPENLSSSDGGVSSSNVPEFNDSKQEATPEGHEYSGAPTSNYSYGFMPPILGNQLPPFENSESQARDVSRLPTFVVQQPFDPTSYYAQFYRSGAESDGRVSPFHSAGVATKYSGNLMVSPQTSQSPQEVGNPLVLSTAAPTPHVTQAAGIMQSSMGVTQPLSVFRPPAGLHLPHYPSNYIPYGHYISPFFIPPPAIHQFLGSGAFPQQPQGGNVYPAPPAAAAKYSLPQYKPGTNTNNSSHVGIPGSYVTYCSAMANYNLSSATAAGNSTSNEDLATSHFKENNAYASGQQSEGSGVWISPPGRDISSIQASSFYNLPQGQMAFAPAQPGHGTFTGVYHPAQPVNATTVHPLLQQSQTMASPADMVGAAASVYQQPQHSQINWPSNF